MGWKGKRGVEDESNFWGPSNGVHGWGVPFIELKKAGGGAHVE